MRTYAIILGIIAAFIFGAVGAQTGFTQANAVAFVLSLSLVVYASLSDVHLNDQRPSRPITFDRLTHF